MRSRFNYIAFVVTAIIIATTASCESPYDNVTGGAVYSGDPYVMLSSEASSIHLEVNSSNNSDQAGLFIDSLVLSHTLDHDLIVTLECYENNTFGEVDTNFRFQREVTIPAGENFGSFYVEALDIDAAQASSYKLSIYIDSCDNDQVIAGINGIKYENQEREKRNKTYSFR